MVRIRQGVSRRAGTAGMVLLVSGHRSRAFAEGRGDNARRPVKSDASQSAAHHMLYAHLYHGKGETYTMFRYTIPFALRMAGRGLFLLTLAMSIGLRAETGQAAQRSTPMQMQRVRSVTGAAHVPRRTVAPEGITLEDGLLSVNVRKQDLRTLITSIATLGNIDVRHAENLGEKRISLRFNALPIVQGLRRLFRAAALRGYALVTEVERGQTKVQRILLLPAQRGARGASRPSSYRRRSPAQTRTRRASSSNASVFDDIKKNTAARRLLSQMVHPNERVRERALERLIRFVPNDEKRDELLDYLEPFMEQLTSSYREDRDEARAGIRKLLRR